MKPVIRYLEDGEKGKSRSLWEEAFPEDSREFDDYYFKGKDYLPFVDISYIVLLYQSY